MINKYLFIYGTLLEAGNEFAVYLRQNSSFYAHGKFRGKLYDMGNYPGAIVDVESGYTVNGSVVIMNDPEAVLKHIDPYEGFGEGERKPYLFTRKLITAETTIGPLECWVYTYNRSVEGRTEITSGDFHDYKHKNQ